MNLPEWMNSVKSQYITSIYWVYMTIETLGYGDIYGNTNLEYYFSIVVMLMGVFVFAYLMGSINSLVENLDQSQMKYLNQEKANLDQWIMKIDRSNHHRTLPNSFTFKFRERFTEFWLNDFSLVHE